MYMEWALRIFAEQVGLRSNVYRTEVVQLVDSLDITIFDRAGRPVNSSTQFTGPSTSLSGEGNGQKEKGTG